MISKEAEISIAASSIFPGFRFSPTDEELLMYYLKKKMDGFHKCVEVIPEVDICKFEPWDLPDKSIIQSESEWFFFSPRGRKYPNGSQSKRATQVGYWKATGKERDVKSGSQTIGTKRTLVFHIGRAPKGERTEWIMHEYCMSGKSQDAASLVVCRLKKKTEFHNGEMSEPDPSPPFLVLNESTTGACSGIGSSGSDGVLEASKRCTTSSYGSHSVGQQNDCISETDRMRDEILKADSSNAQKYVHQEGNNDMDDCFAEIMNDNIVDLGSPSTTPLNQEPMVINKSAMFERMHRPPGQSLMSRVYPFQGTANRRIRLKKIPRSHTVETQLTEGDWDAIIGAAERKTCYKEHSDQNVCTDELDKVPRKSRGRRTSKVNCRNCWYIKTSMLLMLFVLCSSFFGEPFSYVIPA